MSLVIFFFLISFLRSRYFIIYLSLYSLYFPSSSQPILNILKLQDRQKTAKCIPFSPKSHREKHSSPLASPQPQCLYHHQPQNLVEKCNKNKVVGVDKPHGWTCFSSRRLASHVNKCGPHGTVVWQERRNSQSSLAVYMLPPNPSHSVSTTMLYNSRQSHLEFRQCGSAICHKNGNLNLFVLHYAFFLL